MKHLLASLLGTVLLLSPLAAAPVYALSPAYPPMSSLLKGPSSSTLYWYASNGRRYTFPNVNTFYSWFSSDWFAMVRSVSNTELASIPFGGVVTYRPGAKMVKIQTDPRVYVVSRYGILRWVTSESLAQQIYGVNWASQVQDVPDAFFATYTLGSPIYATTDYHVANEYHGVRTPDDNIPFVTPPYAPFTGTISAYLGENNLNVGQSTNLYAQVSNPNTTVQNLRISLFDEFGNTLKTCYQTFMCEVSVSAQSGISGRSYFARAFNDRNEMIESTRTTLYTTQTYNVPGTSLAVGFNRSEARIGEPFTMNATVHPQSTNPPYYRITIYDQWGSVLKTCESVRVCTLDITLSQTADTQRSYYARAFGTDGMTLESNYASLPVVTSPRSFSGSILGVTSSLSSGIPGQIVSIAAGITPTPYDVSDTFIGIINQSTGEVVKRCYNATYCQVSTNLPANVSNVRYFALLTDTRGTSYLTGYSPYITIGSNFSGNPSISTNRTVYSSGEEILIFVSVTGYSSPINNLQLEVYSERDGLLNTCVGTASCNVSRQALTQQGLSSTDRFSLRVKDFVLNQYLPTVYSSSITVYP